MSDNKRAGPGDGIRSMKTTNVFRALNFELYIKPVRAFIRTLYICVNEIMSFKN